MRDTFTLLADQATVLAVDITPVAPPGSEGILTVAGYVMWGIGFALFAAFCVAIGRAAWAHRNGQAGEGAMTIVVVLILAAVFGAAGQIMTPLVG